MPEEEPKGTPLPTADVDDWGDNVVIGENKEQPEEPEEVEEPEEEEPEPEPAVTLEDPGSFEPSDYSFEVTTYDSEGKNAQTIKINSPEQFDELLDKDANFGSSQRLLKAQKQATKMETKLENDQRDHQKKVDEYEKVKQENDARDQATTNMVNEINYLVTNGDLPKVNPELEKADWSDPEVAKQPGVKEQIELLNFMRKENNNRIKHNLAPIKSVLDAYNAFKLDQSKKTAVEQKTRSAERRKEAGARVASSSPNPVSVAPKGVSVGRGGSLRDLGASNWED